MTFQQSNWINGMVVNAPEMDAMVNDIYDKLGALTWQGTPIIIYIDGAITLSSGNVTIPAGVFRFINTTYDYIPYNTAIFGYASQATIPVSGNGWIVARYGVTPTITGQYNYSFPTSYQFVTSLISQTDCVVCTISDGIISSMGNFYLNALLNNPNANGYNITSTSTIDPAYTTSIRQTQISASDATKGYMQYFVNTVNNTNNAKSFMSQYWNIPVSTVEPVYQDGIYASNGDNIIHTRGVNSSNLIFETWAINSNNTGINLVKNSRPTLIGTLSSLSTATNSIATLGDIRCKYYHNNDRYITMSAVWNGTYWVVTMSGQIEGTSNTPSAPATYLASLDCNSVFGINRGYYIAHGVASPATLVVSPNFVSGSAFISNDLSHNNILYISVSMSASVGANILIVFSITFQAYSIT